MQPDMDWIVRYEVRASRRYRRFVSLALISGGPDGKPSAQAIPISALRESDVVVTLNGITGVIMAETDRAGALVALERLRDATGDGGLHAGMATFPEDGNDSTVLMARARDRLRRAAQGEDGGMVVLD